MERGGRQAVFGQRAIYLFGMLLPENARLAIMTPKKKGCAPLKTLKPSHYTDARSLLDTLMRFNGSIAGVLTESNPGTVYVDQLDAPHLRQPKPRGCSPFVHDERGICRDGRVHRAAGQALNPAQPIGADHIGL